MNNEEIKRIYSEGKERYTNIIGELFTLILCVLGQSNFADDPMYTFSFGYNFSNEKNSNDDLNTELYFKIKSFDDKKKEFVFKEEVMLNIDVLTLIFGILQERLNVFNIKFVVNNNEKVIQKDGKSYIKYSFSFNATSDEIEEFKTAEFSLNYINK